MLSRSINRDEDQDALRASGTSETKLYTPSYMASHDGHCHGSSAGARAGHETTYMSKTTVPKFSGKRSEFRTWAYQAVSHLQTMKMKEYMDPRPRQLERPIMS